MFRFVEKERCGLQYRLLVASLFGVLALRSVTSEIDKCGKNNSKLVLQTRGTHSGCPRPFHLERATMEGRSETLDMLEILGGRISLSVYNRRRNCGGRAWPESKARTLLC